MGGPMWPPANQNLRCMFGNSGASYLVEAPASSIEQSGSDKVQTLFKRFPCRLGLPAKQRNSPGSGPAGPENFGYFPSLESSPPAGGISPKRNRGFAAAAATYFAYSGKVGKTPLGEMAFWKDLRLTPWSFRSHFPQAPFLRECRRDTPALAAGAVPS